MDDDTRKRRAEVEADLADTRDLTPASRFERLAALLSAVTPIARRARHWERFSQPVPMPPPRPGALGGAGREGAGGATVSDPWTAALAVIDALDEAGIPCAVGGSLAMAAFGYVRATYDGDVNVFLPMEAARPALEALAAEDLVVLKALFDRGKDWVDIDRIVAVLGEEFDRSYCRRQLVEHAGEESGSVRQLDRVFETWPL